ncbi:MAG: TonB-dependent receptor family protein [Flavobacteriales bacterium]|jgi:outer membrane receptor protein involved in Fe transport|nr:TonB-dependent receptor family protein [Flavobacteriales bacterium]
MRKALFLFVFTLLSCSALFAQQFRISGQVLEASSQESLPYASVVIKEPNTHKIIKGTTSDEMGKFALMAKKGNYILEIQFLSFDNYVKKIELNGHLNLGKITLQESKETLSEVELTAEKDQMSLKVDRREFTVGKDVTNKGASASEVLGNIPSVNVDVEGAVSLRGSENVRILINGRPSSLLGINGTDALKMIPSETIEKVEIITNPSARYDASGEVGIINIVLKKEKRKGFNGVINTNIGYPTAYGLGINLNFKRKKINYFAGLSYNQRARQGTGEFKYSKFGTDTTFTTKTRSEDDNKSMRFMARAGFDYAISDRTNLTFSGMVSGGKGDDTNERNIRDFNNNNTQISQTHRKLHDLEDLLGMDFNANFHHKGKIKGERLTAQLQFSKDFEDENGTITQDVNFLTTNKNRSQLQQSINDENQDNWLFQIDYIRPFSERLKMETGAKATDLSIDVNYKVSEQQKNGDWKIINGFYDKLAYRQKVYAAYGIVSGQLLPENEKLGYQVGLRMEHSDIESIFKLSNKSTPRTYTNLFPSAHLSYKASEQTSWQLSYSKRIDRPRAWSLMPFFSFASERNLFVGNPELDPSYSHVGELTFLNYWEKGSFMASAYYRHIMDVRDRIVLAADPNAGNNVETLIKPFNIGTENNYGLELTGSYNPSKKLKFRASANLYHSSIDGSYTDEHRTLDLSTNNFAWQGRLNMTYVLPRKWITQTTFGYRSKRQDTQGDVDPAMALDFGVSKDLFGDKATIAFSVRDIFNTRRRIAFSEGPDFRMDYDFQWNSRTFRLNFTYRINQKKRRGGVRQRNLRDSGSGGGF